MATYDYPADLLTAQQDLIQVRAELAKLFERLPYSVEPLDAWSRPEGYWRATSPSYPESPGWTEPEQQEVAALRKRERELTTAIVTHRFWNEVAPPERPDARSGLRHALTSTAAGPDGGEQA